MMLYALYQPLVHPFAIASLNANIGRACRGFGFYYLKRFVGKKARKRAMAMRNEFYKHKRLTGQRFCRL
ncbi:MAG: hypothetical protein EAY75_17165 [Bacteroidetes bacterium]|nr:MAG: hypothetical protein EAY75_17165 [Bacteroidota bacterium]